MWSIKKQSSEQLMKTYHEIFPIGLKTEPTTAEIGGKESKNI